MKKVALIVDENYYDYGDRDVVISISDWQELDDKVVADLKLWCQSNRNYHVIEQIVDFDPEFLLTDILKRSKDYGENLRKARIEREKKELEYKAQKEEKARLRKIKQLAKLKAELEGNT